MSDRSSVYCIRNWDQHFETRASRKHQRPFAKVSITTSLDGLVLRRLLSHPQGAAAYGVWVLLLQIAAKLPHRGILADQSGCYSAADLSLLTGIPESQMAAALELLCSPRIELLELILLDSVSPPSAEMAALSPDERIVPKTVIDVETDAAPVTAAEVATEDHATSPAALVGVTVSSPQSPPLEPSIPVPVTAAPNAPRRLPDQFPQQKLQVPGLPEFRKLLNAPGHPKKSRQFVSNLNRQA